jgi:hypothetical protein
MAERALPGEHHLAPAPLYVLCGHAQQDTDALFTNLIRYACQNQGWMAGVLVQGPFPVWNLPVICDSIPLANQVKGT